MPAKRAFDFLEFSVRVAAIACGYGCLGLCFLVGFEIIARKLLDYSLQGVDEIGGYVLAVTASVGFAYALFHKAHARIELALFAMPPAIQAVLNVLAAMLLAGFSTFMAWRAWGALGESLDFGSRAATPLQTPLWIPQSLWAGGLALFAVIGVAMSLRASALLALRRDVEGVNRAYGPQSLEEEIEEQMAEAERQMRSDARGEAR